MKNLILSLAFLAMSGFATAQKTVTIKGGTIVPVEAVKNVRATEVQIGQNVDFKVARDVIVDGVVAIPLGTIVKGSSPAPASRISVLSVLYQILRGLSKLIQPFGGEVHAVVPLQRPVGEGELHELVVFQQLLA